MGAGEPQELLLGRQHRNIGGGVGQVEAGALAVVTHPRIILLNGEYRHRVDQLLLGNPT